MLSTSWEIVFRVPCRACNFPPLQQYVQNPCTAAPPAAAVARCPYGVLCVFPCFHVHALLSRSLSFGRHPPNLLISLLAGFMSMLPVFANAGYVKESEWLEACEHSTQWMGCPERLYSLSVSRDRRHAVLTTLLAF